MEGADVTAQNVSDASEGDPGRRLAMATLLGGTMLFSANRTAAQELPSSVDPVPLQLILNLLYVTVNYSQLGFYADGRTLGLDLIRGGELRDRPGVPVTRTGGIRAVAFPTPAIRQRMGEITDEFWGRLNTVRGFLRADAPAQTQIDLTPVSFTSLMRQAGAIGPNETFDPYASEDNFLIGLFILIDIYPATIRGLASRFSNPTVLAWLGGFAAVCANVAANIRAMLYLKAQTTPALLTTIDRIAEWRSRVDGSSTFSQGLTPVGSGTAAVANLAAVGPDGLIPALGGEQALNIMFMTAGTATQGGFFPTGINGTIKTSAAN